MDIKHISKHISWDIKNQETLFAINFNNEELFRVLDRSKRPTECIKFMFDFYFNLKLGHI